MFSQHWKVFHVIMQLFVKKYSHTYFHSKFPLNFTNFPVGEKVLSASPNNHFLVGRLCSCSFTWHPDVLLSLLHLRGSGILFWSSICSLFSWHCGTNILTWLMNCNACRKQVLWSDYYVMRHYSLLWHQCCFVGKTSHQYCLSEGIWSCVSAVVSLVVAVIFTHTQSCIALSCVIPHWSSVLSCTEEVWSSGI